MPSIAVMITSSFGHSPRMCAPAAAIGAQEALALHLSSPLPLLHTVQPLLLPLPLTPLHHQRQHPFWPACWGVLAQAEHLQLAGLAVVLLCPRHLLMPLPLIPPLLLHELHAGPSCAQLQAGKHKHVHIMQPSPPGINSLTQQATARCHALDGW